MFGVRQLRKIALGWVALVVSDTAVLERRVADAHVQADGCVAASRSYGGEQRRRQCPQPRRRPAQVQEVADEEQGAEAHAVEVVPARRHAHVLQGESTCRSSNWSR